MIGVFLLGMLCTLFLLGLAWVGVRSWRKALPPPLPQPQSEAQKANERAYEQHQQDTPKVVSMHMQRRPRHRPEAAGSWHAQRKNR